MYFFSNAFPLKVISIPLRQMIGKCDKKNVRKKEIQPENQLGLVVP